MGHGVPFDGWNWSVLIRGFKFWQEIQILGGKFKHTLGGKLKF